MNETSKEQHSFLIFPEVKHTISVLKKEIEGVISINQVLLKPSIDITLWEFSTLGNQEKKGFCLNMSAVLGQQHFYVDHRASLYYIKEKELYFALIFQNPAKPYEMKEFPISEPIEEHRQEFFNISSVIFPRVLRIEKKRTLFISPPEIMKSYRHLF